MTVQSLTKSTKSTKSTNINKVSHSGSLREQQCLLGNLCEEPLGPEANASLGGVGQRAFGSRDQPAEWGYVKIDLFDNSTAQQLAKNQRRLRLSLAIHHISQSRWIYLRAGINSPWRHIKRGLDFSDDRDVAHYRAIETARDELIDSGLLPRSGKFYLRGSRGKDQYAIGISGVVAALPDLGEYVAGIVYGDQCYWYHLNNTALTEAQRRAGIVSSSVSQRPRRIRAEDLFR